MCTNRLLCLAQALTLTAIGGFTSFVVCVAKTELAADLADILLGVLIVSVFACTCLAAAMMNANRKALVSLQKELGDRDGFAQAAAARALIAFSQGADNEDAEVLQLRR